MADPFIDEHFPVLGALERILERLTSGEHVVTTVDGPTSASARSDREHAEAMAREFNRPGGPRLLPRAIKGS